jgi:manganese/zinc/iron transport system substrate-binding protein
MLPVMPSLLATARCVLGTALTALLFSCGEAPPSATDASTPGKIGIVATTGMIGDVAAQIAGDRASVQTLIGEGVDPHLYKPAAMDVRMLQAADVVFFNGLMLEGKMGDILAKLGQTGKPLYAVSEGLDKFVIAGGEHHDPHIWMDVAGWTQAARVMTGKLSAFDPDHAAGYEERSAAYLAEMQKLDAYARTSLASIPETQRVLVTAHDAFSYMARAYGLEVRGIQGISTESEAGLKDIEDLVRFLVIRKIPAVFVETSVSQKNIQALIEGARAAGHEVKIGGSLFSDAMGARDTYEGTYIGMIDHNVTTITRALGGSAPEKGLHGKLK